MGMSLTERKQVWRFCGTQAKPATDGGNGGCKGMGGVPGSAHISFKNASNVIVYNGKGILSPGRHSY